MRPAGRVFLSVLALAAGSVAALAQSVISAHSGLIHYIEGQVYLGDQPVDSKFGNFPQVKENAQLRTEEGRAEVLLTPGVFLRLGESSSFKMMTNRLIDTRLELLTGSAVVEAADMPKDNGVTLVLKDAAVRITKKGIYRFDASPAEIKVYDGEAQVTAGEKNIELKEGHALALDTMAMSKFDKNMGDALTRWSERRAEYIAMANVSAANSLRTSNGYSGGSYGGAYGGAYGGGFFNSGWYFNPYFGMYTFVPGLSGSWYSPYGYRFWSPFDVYMAYMPGYYYMPSYYYGGGGIGKGNTASTGRAYSRAGYSGFNSTGAHPVTRSSGAVASSGAVGRTGGSVAPSRGGGMSSGVSSGMGSISRGSGASSSPHR